MLVDHQVGRSELDQQTGGMQPNSVESSEANAVGIMKGWSTEGAWLSSPSCVVLCLSHSLELFLAIF